MLSKKIVMLIFVLSTAMSLNAAIILDQDFEDSSVFVLGQPFQKAGVGNGTSLDGIWSNAVVNGDHSPKIAAINSSFSTGSQAVLIQRDATYGSGNLLGARTNVSATGQFEAEFSFIVPSTTSQFSISLANSTGGGLNQVGIAYYSGALKVRDNGAWKDRTSGVSANSWFKISITGDISTGIYNTYVNFGTWGGNLGSASFNNTQLSSIAGIYVAPWVAGETFYIDDVKLTAIPEPATIVVMSLGLLINIVRRK
ncbi:MAG: PEP-CTERM sorting domain-containing protein [Phycisphaerales bacterium]